MQQWWGRLTRKQKPLSPAEAALHRLSESGDTARREGRLDDALNIYNEGLAEALRQGSASGEDVFHGLIGALQTERGYYEAAEAALEASVAAAERTGDPVRRARSLGNLGAHYMQRDLLNKAQNILEQALELARTAGDPTVLGLTLANLGGLYLKRDNPGYAIRLLREASDRLQGVPAAYQSGAVAFAVGQLGQAHLSLNEADRGFRMLTQAIRLAQQAGDVPQELRWTNALANGLFNAGQLQDALRLYERSEELESRVRVPDAVYRQTALLNRATIHHRLNQPDIAMGFAQRALEQARAESDRHLEARVQALLSELYKGSGNLALALEAAAGAVAVYDATDIDETTDPIERESHIDSLLTLGMLYQDKGEPQRALDEFNRALALTDSEGSSVGRAKALRRIGDAYQARGEMGAALEHWNRALDIFVQNGQHSLAARVVCEIGAAKRAIGGINMALTEYERATMFLNNVKDAPTRGLVLSNVANLYTDLGEVETAASFFQESIQLARQTGDRRSESVRLGNYGWFYVATGRPADAIRVLEEALSISRAIGDQTLIAVQTNNLAQAYHGQRDYPTARNLFEQALLISTDLTDKHWGPVFEANYARTLLAEGKTEEALSRLEKALAGSRVFNDQENIIRALNRIAEAQLRLDRIGEAESAAQEAETIARKWGYRKGQADALAVRSDCAAKQGQHEQAEQLRAEAGRLYAILHDPLAATYMPRPVPV
jgi:tetratricopeptide (TPR) repeat protein